MCTVVSRCGAPQDAECRTLPAKEASAQVGLTCSEVEPSEPAVKHSSLTDLRRPLSCRLYLAPCRRVDGCNGDPLCGGLAYTQASDSECSTRRPRLSLQKHDRNAMEHRVRLFGTRADSR